MTLVDALKLSILVPFLVSSLYLSWTDIKTKRLLNSILLPLTAYVLFMTTVIQVLEVKVRWLLISFGIPAIVFLAFLAIYSVYPKGLGMGDLKAILLIGLVLCRENPAHFFYSVAASFLLGAVFVLVARVVGKASDEFPFGPFLLLPAAGLAIMQYLN